MKNKYGRVLIIGIALFVVTSLSAEGYDKLQEIKNNQEIIKQKVGQLLSASSVQVNFMLPMLRPSDASRVKQMNEQSINRYNKALSYLNGSLDNNDILAYQEALRRFSDEEYSTMASVHNTNISMQQGIQQNSMKRAQMISDANTRAANTVIETTESWRRSNENTAGKWSDYIRGEQTSVPVYDSNGEIISWGPKYK